MSPVKLDIKLRRSKVLRVGAGGVRRNQEGCNNKECYEKETSHVALKIATIIPLTLRAQYLSEKMACSGRYASIARH